jgi:3-(3-hydroxy-phenyl)propionate hydroxylase
MERLFREAALGLARQYPFARQLVNTGRMAIANPYTRSSVCDTGGGQSVQNVGLVWPDGSKGTLNDLLEWAGGRLLLLLFGDVSPQCYERLRQLGETAPVRSVHVLGADDPAGAVEHVRDPHGHLQGACHVFGHAWVLIRPDSYIAATGESVDSTLVRAVSKAIAAAGERA